MLNKVQLIGNLGDEPEVRQIPNGGAVTNISVATTRRWKNKETGQREDATEWHRVVFFNRLAEVAGEYLKKGSQVFIEGRLQTRKWTDNDGIDRYPTEIIASEMQMLGKKNGNASEAKAWVTSKNGRLMRAMRIPRNLNARFLLMPQSILTSLE